MVIRFKRLVVHGAFGWVIGRGRCDRAGPWGRVAPGAGEVGLGELSEKVSGEDGSQS
jgi:hypothetical protein